jgi:hypothetical protein
MEPEIFVCNLYFQKKFNSLKPLPLYLSQETLLEHYELCYEHKYVTILPSMKNDAIVEHLYRIYENVEQKENQQIIRLQSRRKGSSIDRNMIRGDIVEIRKQFFRMGSTRPEEVIFK